MPRKRVKPKGKPPVVDLSLSVEPAGPHPVDTFKVSQYDYDSLQNTDDGFECDLDYLLLLLPAAATETLYDAVADIIPLEAPPRVTRHKKGLTRRSSSIVLKPSEITADMDEIDLSDGSTSGHDNATLRPARAPAKHASPKKTRLHAAATPRKKTLPHCNSFPSPAPMAAPASEQSSLLPANPPVAEVTRKKKKKRSRKSKAHDKGLLANSSHEPSPEAGAGAPLLGALVDDTVPNVPSDKDTDATYVNSTCSEHERVIQTGTASLDPNTSLESIKDGHARFSSPGTSHHSSDALLANEKKQQVSSVGSMGEPPSSVDQEGTLPFSSTITASETNPGTSQSAASNKAELDVGDVTLESKDVSSADCESNTQSNIVSNELEKLVVDSSDKKINALDEDDKRTSTLDEDDKKTLALDEDDKKTSALDESQSERLDQTETCSVETTDVDENPIQVKKREETTDGNDVSSPRNTSPTRRVPSRVLSSNISSDNPFISHLRPTRILSPGADSELLPQISPVKTINGLSHRQIMSLELSDVKIKLITSASKLSKYTLAALKFTLQHTHLLFQNDLLRALFYELCISIALFDDEGAKTVESHHPDVFERFKGYLELTCDSEETHNYDYTMLAYFGHVLVWAVHQQRLLHQPLLTDNLAVDVLVPTLATVIGGYHLWDRLKRQLDTMSESRWKRLVKFRSAFQYDEDQFVLILRFMQISLDIP